MKTLKINSLLIVVSLLFLSCSSYQQTNSNSMSILEQKHLEKELLTTNFLIENSGEFIELMETSRFGFGFHLRVLGSGKETPKYERSYRQFLKDENGERKVFYTTPEVLNYFDAIGFEIVNITEKDNRRSLILKRGKSLEQKTKNKDFDFGNESYSNVLH